MSETAFITGANRGIGLALARACLERGWKVVATSRSAAGADALTVLQGEFPGRIEVVRLDVTDDRQVAEVLAGGDFPVVDILINNAAVFPERGDETLEELHLEHLTEAFDTNVVGVVRVTRALLPRLARSKRPRVINISSTAGSIWRKHSSEYYAYSTSKAALNMITRSMAYELGRRGVTVVAVSPGWVRTEMGGDDAPLTAEESARELVTTIDRLTPGQAGCFLERNGEPCRAAW